jgi:hypothetical protein
VGYLLRPTDPLQVLKDDPAYANRKFKTGDTVGQRYDAFTECMQRGLKYLALNGMWSELGSSDYEHKSYRGLDLCSDQLTPSTKCKGTTVIMPLPG